MAKQNVRAVSLDDAVYIQGEPVVIGRDMKRPVLLDFFTFGCINCINVMPDIKALALEFGNSIDIVSVHTPKFDREKDSKALAETLKYLDISHAVIVDNDKKLWEAYAVKAWPTWVLVDSDAYVVLHAQGENKLELFKTEIQSLVATHTPTKEKELLSSEYSVIEASKTWLCIARQSELDIYVDQKRVKTLKGFSHISGLLIVDDTLFVADRQSGTVSAVDLFSFTVRALAEGLRAPWGLELVHTNLFISLAGSHKIAALNLDTLAYTEIAGNGFEGLRDGNGDQVLLAQPQALVFDEDRLWFLDTESSALRFMQGREVATEFGEGLYTFGDDNDKLLLQHPQAMDFGRYGDGCGTGRLFIADTYNHKIKVYNPQDKSMQTLVEDIFMPLSLSKSGCKLYLISMGESKPLIFDLKSMTLESLELV